LTTLTVFYENYVKCDINELSGDALELRRKLIKFVGERDNEVPFKYNNLKSDFRIRS